ncbi:MAG: hypothetical protein E7514_07590 [Ruminococcaceae bacterium]|nr:hypothetical protein [Oscillospiraceae bacterium]
MAAKKNQAKRYSVTSAYAAFAIICVFVLILIFFFVGSIVTKDREVSVLENRTLAGRPHISAGAVLDGSFAKGLDEYFCDQFPFRDKLLGINSKISNKFSQLSFGDDGMVIVEKDEKDDFAGQSID